VEAVEMTHEVLGGEGAKAGRITPTRIGSVAVLAADGEIDLQTASRLHAALAEVLEKAHATAVILDLTEARFLGSTGIAALVDAHWQSTQLHTPLTIIVTARGLVHRALRTAGVDHHLALRFDIAAALRELETQ
jgi:anti-sigma B factor antagonist